jgi:hypothetical protein
MIISNPRVEEAEGRVRTIARIAFDDGRTTDLWFAVHPDHARHLRAGDADPFLLALLMVAMANGEDIRIEGTISKRLKFHADHHLPSLLRLVTHPMRPAVVTAEAVVPDAEQRGPGVGTGFSAGVDSFTTLLDHGIECTDPEYRLTHLFLNSVGTVDERDMPERLAQVREVADQFGYAVVEVRSNLAVIHNMPFIKSHTLRNLACAAALPGLLRRYYYSSTHTYDAFRGRASDVAYLEPALVPMLSTAAMEFLPVGSEYNRVDKTRRIAPLPVARSHLNVCIAQQTARNCSRCNKCCRTLMTLECLGELENFREAFDLDMWRSVRSAYIGETVLNHKMRKVTLSREVADLARASGTRFTLHERLLGLLATVAPRELYDRITRSPAQMPPRHDGP